MDCYFELKLNKCEPIPMVEHYDVRLFPKDIKVRKDKKVKQLGAPIGSKQFCNGFTGNKLAEYQKFFNKRIDISDI